MMLLACLMMLVLDPVTSQDGRPITTCCDGYQAPEGARNGTCRQVTYHVQQMYQACPPKGTVIEVEKPEASSSTRAEVAELRGKVAVLEDLYKDLHSKVSGSVTPSVGHKEVLRDAVHNITTVGGAYPVDCTELFSLGYRATGVYLIKPAGAPQPFPAFCELAYEGWTIITRRFDGSVDFYRKWDDYKLGFGSAAGEHWIGNDRLHWLTNQKNYQLRIEFTRWSDGRRYYADYSRFKIEAESAKYKLHVTGHSGNSGHDGLEPHDGMVFSTWDRDHDTHSSIHCAQQYKGAFWYYNCHNYCVVTALWQSSCSNHECIEWGRQTALKQIVWKVRSI